MVGLMPADTFALDKLARWSEAKKYFRSAKTVRARSNWGRYFVPYGIRICYFVFSFLLWYSPHLFIWRLIMKKS